MTLAPRFDEYQWQDRKNYPVSATRNTDGSFSTYGIDFADYSRCHTEVHKLSPNRRLDAPEWAFNETARRELLLNFCERRVGINKPWQKPASVEELRIRLEAAQRKMQEKEASLRATLQTICADYVALKKKPLLDPDERKRLRQLEIEIQSYDTQIIICTRVAEIVLGIVHYYYGCGCDSVETATRLGVRSPHVRQILWRLHRNWKLMQIEPKLRPEPSQPRKGPTKGIRSPETNARQSASMRATWALKKKDPEPADPEPVVQTALDARYLEYWRYCKRIGIRPAPCAQWSEHSDYLVGPWGALHKFEGARSFTPQH